MKTILMDCFGVASSEPHFIKSVLVPLLPNAMESEVKTAYNELENGRISEEQFWERFSAEKSKKRQMVERIPTDPQLSETVSYLKRSNYDIVLFSEFPEVWLKDLTKTKQIKTFFSKVVATPELGYSKTDPKLFKKAKKEFEAQIVIDDKDAVLEAASRAGLTTVLKETDRLGTSFQPDYRIQELKQLKQIL